MAYRQIIIDEENEELLRNEVFDEEYEDESCEGCEEVCSRVSEMLEVAGVETDDLSHDEMLSELEGMRLVKKENGGKKVVKLVKKENGNGSGKRR